MSRLNFSRAWSQVSWLNWKVCCLSSTSQEPGPKCPGSRRAWSQVSWLNWKVCCLSSTSQEPGPKCPGSRRAWSQVSWLNWKVCRLSSTSQEPSLKCRNSMEKSVASLSLFCCSLFSVNCSLWIQFRFFVFQFQMGFTICLR